MSTVTTQWSPQRPQDESVCLFLFFLLLLNQFKQLVHFSTSVVLLLSYCILSQDTLSSKKWCSDRKIANRYYDN